MFRSGRWILPTILLAAVVGACGDDPVDASPDVPFAPVQVTVSEQAGAALARALDSLHRRAGSAGTAPGNEKEAES